MKFTLIVSVSATIAVVRLTPRLGAQVHDSNYKQPSAADTSSKVTFGGFVDTYYAWDFDRPHTFDRAYTTQPARHDEFNVNLAFVEAKVAGPRYRGRLALQWGTSVQANYINEPMLGIVSGPSVSQFLQEAVVGYQLGPTLWVDGGIFLSHLGFETWISRDNLSYTRSMVADFSPYYEAGVKLTWAASSTLNATFVLVNGWQNISAENTPPGGGVRLDYSPTPKVTLTYDNYLGNSAPDSLPARIRTYHDVFAQYNPCRRWQFAVMYSLGTQSESTPSGGTASWWGMTSIGKFHLTSRVSLIGRVEAYSDPSQVIVATGLPASFHTLSASLGADVNFVGPVLWRSELRGYRSKQAVCPLHTAGDYSQNDSFIVTSLALTF